MSMQERTEWPSLAHLEELREQGVVSYSRYLSRALAALAFMFVLWLGRGNMFEFLAGVQGLLGAHEIVSNDALLEKVSLLISSFWSVFLWPVLASVVIYVSASLLQTRFLFRGLKRSHNIDQNGANRHFGVYRIARSLIAGLSSCFVILSIGLSFTWYYSASVFGLLNIREGELGAALARLISNASAFIIPLLLLTGVLGWLLSRLIFMHEHRMTAHEVRAQGMEQ